MDEKEEDQDANSKNEKDERKRTVSFSKHTEFNDSLEEVDRKHFWL